MQTVAYTLIQLLVILALAPLVNGIIGKVKALAQKRRGAPLLQMYFDLAKLMRKQPVVSDTASWIFRVTPYIVFATALAAAWLAPVTTVIEPAALPGDIIVLFSILVLGRFFMVLAALDTGSTFGGMGGSREALIAALIEPAVLLCAFTVGLYAQSTSVIAMMVAMQGAGAPLLQPVFIPVFLAMVVIILAETARIPVDDPATHLELTMVHEAMLLEYSGRHLSLMEYGAAIKQLALMTLLVNFFLPHDQWITLMGAGAVALSLLLYAAKVALAAVLIGVIEAGTVKFRFFSVPNIAALAFILALLGFLQYFVFGR